LSISVAAADGTGDTVSILDGEEKQSLARGFAQTDAFQRLAREARSLGYEVATAVDRISAGVTEAEGYHREVISFGIDGVPRNSQGGIVLSRDPTTDSIEMASLDVEHYDDDGLFSSVDRHVLYERGVETDGGVSVERVEPDADAVDRLLDRLEAADQPSSDYDIPDDFPDEFDVTKCDGCYFAASKICTFLCGQVGSYVCGLLGLSVVGAVGCWALTKAVCWALDELSGCGDDVAATICKSTGLDVCPSYRPGDPIGNVPYI
jgi:halocin C8-like bacteriocin domain-containing protein